MSHVTQILSTMAGDAELLPRRVMLSSFSVLLRPKLRFARHFPFDDHNYFDQSFSVWHSHPDGCSLNTLILLMFVKF